MSNEPQPQEEQQPQPEQPTQEAPASDVPAAAATGGAIAEIPSTDEDRTMALLAHLGGILAGFVVPLVIWLIKKDQSKFVDNQAKEALNFQLTLLIAYVVSVPLMCLWVGYLTFMAAWVCAIVFSIVGALAAQKGELYRYPISIRMIQ